MRYEQTGWATKGGGRGRLLALSAGLIAGVVVAAVAIWPDNTAEVAAKPTEGSEQASDEPDDIEEHVTHDGSDGSDGTRDFGDQAASSGSDGERPSATADPERTQPDDGHGSGLAAPDDHTQGPDREDAPTAHPDLSCSVTVETLNTTPPSMLIRVQTNSAVDSVYLTLDGPDALQVIQLGLQGDRAQLRLPAPDRKPTVAVYPTAQLRPSERGCRTA